MGSRKMPRKRDHWCHPHTGGHPPLYFRGHQLISRAQYVSAVGPDDCDPHVATGRQAIRKRGPRSEREQYKRM
jgi:hypothetical protein